MSIDNKAAWLHLLHAPGIGFARTQQLLATHHSAANILAQKQFEPALKIPASATQYLQRATDDDIASSLEWLQKQGNHLITLDDPLYPPQLKQIPDPPIVLFVKGDPQCLLLPQLAVVGSRHATQGGTQNAQAFCYDLARKGMVITSGLAAGIDATAHQAALDAQAPTVAVMGTGINTIYPKSNQELAKNISRHGAVVSEFALNTPPNAHNFPRRNRVIAGLALGTLVIEAAQKSGTLITARLAMEYNRPVMAIPGSIHNPVARGCHALIKQGARLVESAQDIMEELEPNIQMLSQQLQSNLDACSNTALEKHSATPNIELTETQQHIFNHLDFHPTSFDAIVRRTKLSSNELASDLLILELSGLVEKLPGANYQKL